MADAPEILSESSWLAPRIAWCLSFRSLVADRQDDLIGLIRDEIGKSGFEALTTEIVPLVASCKWHERHAGRLLKPRKVVGGSIWQLGQKHDLHRAPLGRVGIIATWNYPVQLLGIQMVQALVAGNRVMVKPSERSPGSQGLLLDLAVEAGGGDWIERMPATREAGQEMLSEHRFDHVVFTGSTEVGRSIAQTLAQTLTPSTLELSGCDSSIVLADADVAMACDSIWYALRLNAGQTCMAPRRIIVEREVLDGIEAGLRERAAEGVGSVDAAVAAEIDRLAEDAIAAGGVKICESPRIISRCDPMCGLARGEFFGPGLAIVVAENLDDAIRIHRQSPRSLATSIYSKNTRRAKQLAGALGSGVVTINDAIIPTGHPGLAIGGLGKSGWGVSRGELGLLAMTRAVHVSVTGAKIRTPVKTPDEQTQSRIAGFVRWWSRRGS